MKKHEPIDVVPAREGVVTQSSATSMSARAADSKNKTELRKSIEASTARLMTIAMTRGSDSDPEAA